MVTKDYSKSRMRENRTYGSVRGGQSNLIPSTRLTGLSPRGFLSLTAAMPLRVVEGASKFIGGASLYKTIQPRLRSEVGLFSLGRKPGCKGFIIRGRLL